MRCRKSQSNNNSWILAKIRGSCPGISITRLWKLTFIIWTSLLSWHWMWKNWERLKLWSYQLTLAKHAFILMITKIWFHPILWCKICKIGTKFATPSFIARCAIWACIRSVKGLSTSILILGVMSVFTLRIGSRAVRLLLTKSTFRASIVFGKTELSKQ